MRIIERRIGDVSILDIRGKILIGEGDREVREAILLLLEEGRRKIALNFAEVPYMDPAGLGEVVRSYTAVEQGGGKLKIFGMTRRVRGLFGVTKLLEVFRPFDTEEAAIASFAAR